MNSLQQQIDALQATVAALAARVQAVETHHAAAPSSDETLDKYWKGPERRLDKERREKNSNYAVAVCSFVSQVNNSGHSGTASGLNFVTEAKDLATDADIEKNIAWAQLFVTDSLVPRCLREMVALCFEGEPMEATSADLAARLSEDVTRIDAALAPLVQRDVLRRGLRSDGTPFYLWEGNDHFPMTLLLRN